ncbi:MAG: penicillin-binding protein, partial [Bacteroidetes bacterium]
MNIASLKEQLAINAKLAIERLKNFRPERRHAFLAGKLAALGLLLGLLGVLLLWVLVYTGCLGPLPTAEELRNIRHHTASEVYTADSVLMGKYYIENRSRVQYEDIAPSVIQALVATEDARFYEHNGVDARSLARVGIKSVLLGDESAGGGSTISQQLAKNLYPRRRAYGPFSMPVNKLKEMIIARRLEKVYSKEEILTLYLNTVPFGENVFGIAAAADRFFHESPARLKPEQAAVLVGMLKATTAYNPRLHPDKSLARRNVVLDQMHKYDYLPAEVADSLKALPLELNYHYITHNSGLAPYFREHLRHEIEQMLEGTPYNLYTDGLKIYTTIDSRMQRYAEQAVATEMKRIQAAFFKHWQGRNPWGNEEDVILRAIKQSERYRMLKRQGLSEEEIRKSFEQPVPMSLFSWEGEQNKEMSPLDSLKYYNHFLHAGFMAMEPHTGFVRAWVGGIDHKYFQYDHVKSRRQVGSTFKPIVYAAALEQGIDPCEYISNERLVYKAYDDWSPGNADGNYEGAYSM